jgi:hypothetical protein
VFLKCQFDQVVGRHIDTVADTLPPDVVAAAQERGTAQDLWATVVELAQQFENKHSPHNKQAMARSA